MSIHHTNNQFLQLVSSEKRLSLQVFGQFCLRNEAGQVISISSKKTRVLLAALAFRGEMSRRELARLLWSRHADEHALTSLRQALSRLKSSVGEAWPRLLLVSRHRVKLHDGVGCDLRALLNSEQLDSSKRQALSIACKHRLFEGLDNKDPVINGWLADCRGKFAVHLQNLIQQQMSVSGSAEEHSLLANDARVLAHLYVVAEKNTDTQGQRMDSLCENYVDYLAAKVEYFWVNGVLKRLGLDQVLPQLKETTPNKGAHREGIRIPADINNILSTFREAGGRVVIQGEPEYGRTTLMLRLLVELLKQVKSKREAPVPVVLNVAHWTGNRLYTWLKNELSYRYDLPNDVAGRFFQSRRVLLFLEGVDELPRQLFASFVHEINSLSCVQGDFSFSVFCREELQLQAHCKIQLNASFKIISPVPTGLLVATE